MSGCTCSLTQIGKVWLRIGDPCGYCRAWDLTYRTQSIQPLNDYLDRLKRETGDPASECPSSDAGAETNITETQAGILVDD